MVSASDNEGPPGSDSPNGLGKADIERLGRQRPSVFSTRASEVVFVSTIVASMMLSEYFISGFNVVLPSIAESLDLPESQRTWPSAVPTLTTAAILLPCARLCDRYGGRIVFILGHVWLLVWSLVAGFSQNPTMLILCRALQGMSSGVFLPAGLALLAQTYRPGPRKNVVFSLYGAMACIGFYFGIFMGALTGQLLDWRWYFWIGTVLVLGNTVAGIFAIPKNLDDGDVNVRMDWWGACTIVPGLVLVVFALTDGGNAAGGWRNPYIYVTFIVGVLFLCAAVYVEGWVSAEPILPAEMFRPKYMKRLLAAMFCSYGAFGVFLFYATFQYATLFPSRVRRISANRTLVSRLSSTRLHSKRPRGLHRKLLEAFS